MEIFWLMVRGKLPCMFRMLTGLYCPGCGGTRAVKALLTGHPIQSFLYHPVVLYVAAVAVWLVVCHLVYLVTGNTKFQKRLEDRYVYIGIGIVAINFILKNLLLAVWGVDVLELLAV